MTEELKKAIDAEDYETAALLRDGKISYYNVVDYTDRLFIKEKCDDILNERLLLYADEYNVLEYKTIFLKGNYFEVMFKSIINVHLTRSGKKYEVYVILKNK